jgi:hypothetical protein
MRARIISRVVQRGGGRAGKLADHLPGKGRSVRAHRGNAPHRSLRFEALEDRALLSAVPALPANWQAHAPATPHRVIGPADTSSSSQLVPAQVRAAYGLSNGSSTSLTYGISFQGIQGDGSGQTIAIVDAYDYPSALSDLNTFSSTYGLPQFNVAGGPTFQKLDQNGGASYPGTDPSGKLNGSNNDWELEAALDIEWAHAMAPMANIILFEANTAGTDLYTAVQTAANTPGAVAVSMSWSGAEFSGETSYDSTYFVTPAGHLGGSATMGGSKLPGGVTFLAATGDSGAYAFNSSTITPQYPAVSPNVVAVGGTTLTVNQSSSNGNYYYNGETSWGNGTSSGTAGGGGGGISGVRSISTPELQPSCQVGVVSSSLSTNGGAFSSPRRTYPDVSADANSTVLVYDSYSTVGNWWAVSGTSLACPLWAGMIAVADQGRAIAGLGSLYGASQTLPQLYSLGSGAARAAYFTDVAAGSSIGPTSGSPSYFPAAGYDLATGLGSPKAQTLLPALIGATNLAFTQQPSSAPAGAAISPSISVAIEDSAGNIIASDNSYVTIAFANNPSGANLLGTLTVQAVNGAATFTGLKIDAAGTGYRLVAGDGTLTAATSNAFNIAANPAQPAIVAGPSADSNPVAGTTAALAVQGSDPNNQTLTYAWSVLSVPGGATAPTFSPNNDSTSASTTATFSAPGQYTLFVLLTDASGYSKGASLAVTVVAALSSLSISSGAATTLSVQSQEQFTASGSDQFGNSLGSLPSVAWSAANGTIASSGLYTPPASGNSDTVTVSSGSLQASVAVSIAAPLGWWKFNEGSGTTASDSGTGTLDTATVSSGNWVSAANGTNGTAARAFSGNSTTLINLGNPSKLSFTGQITLSAWVKPASNSASQYLIDHRTNTTNDLFLMITSNGLYEVGVNNGSIHGASYAVPAGDLNTWVHLVGTYDGSAWRLYRNGQLVNASTDAQGAINPSGNWGIGGAATGNNNKRYFTGSIDDVRIYNAAISSAAAAGLMATPPTVAAAAAASANPVTGASTALSVLGSDDAGPSTLSYTWAIAGTPPAAVSFSANGSNAAQNTTASFTQAGTYSFIVTMTNVAGLTATSSVNVTVNQTPTSVSVQSGLLASDGTITLAATASDQFGNALASQPQFTWTLVGGGGLSTGGIYSPPYATGSAQITATNGALSGSATVAFPGAAQWTAGGTASWNGPGVWTSSATGTVIAAPGARGVAGDIAVLATGTGGTLSLDGASPILAGLTFADSGSYVLAQGSGGVIHLANGAATPVVTVAGGLQTISAPLVLDGSATFTAAAGSQLTVSGPISVNGNSVTVSGAGKVVFSGPGGSDIGNTTVTSGKLVIDDSSTLASGSNLSIGDASFFAAAAVVSPALVASSPGGSAPTTSPISSSGIASVFQPTFVSQAPAAAVLPARGAATRLAAGVVPAFAAVFPAVSFTGPSLPGRLAAALRAAAAVAASTDSLDTHRNKLASIQAADAIFANYAR